MNFLAPLALLWLPLIGGVIVVLYMLRLRRRDVTVSSVMLWQAVLKDTQANAPFQKLRRNLLLFLQLLIAGMLIFAVSRPFFWAAGLGGKTVAVVLDASASMKATDVAGGRFAQAVQEARHIIEQKSSGDGVALVLAAEKPIPLCPLTTDKEKLLRALESAKPTDASHDMKEAITFAASLISSRAGAQVTVVTDGAFGRLDEMALGGPRLGFVVVGKQSENIGITAFDVRDTLGGGSARQAFVTVQNVGKTEKTVPLEIRVNDKLTAAKAVTLKPGESRSETFDNLRADTGGIVQARIDSRDDLASDNLAHVTLAPRRRIKTLLVTEGSPFLEKVLGTDDRIVLDAVRPADYQTTDSKDRDLTIFDDAAPPKVLLPGRYLFWGVNSLGSDVVPATATNMPDVDRPQILDWSRTHPLMRFVDMANVNLLRAKTIAPAPWATTLAETDAGPLIVAGEKSDSRAVYIGFSLLESDMPLRVAFPIFLTNCLQWLTARPGDSGGVTRPGDVMPLAASATAGTLTITRPDSTQDTLNTAPNTSPLYDHTTTVGVYKASGKNFEQYFAVSLLSPVETNIRPVEKPSVAVTDVVEDGEKAPGTTTNDPTRSMARQETWTWLAGIALLILTIEWVVYHRRI